MNVTIKQCNNVIIMASFIFLHFLIFTFLHFPYMAKVNKSEWRMPRLTEAMKDVISCDKLGLGANDL